MREKLIRFMQGRYGMDYLGRFTIILGLAAIILSMFIDSAILSILAWACIIYAYFRMFSRNVRKRYDENVRFLNKTAKIRGFFKSQKNLMAQRKDYHIYTCPGCKQKIRIPRGKGKIEIRCPKCGTTFIKKS